ncbi:MAG: 4Fe-4S binding protein [Alphaproteobacteria bacterium]|nr:4Fe-4S binding protein [Alphaproteobacteria bacterium]
MKLNDKRILVCDCEGTMPLDGKSLAKALGGADVPRVSTQLCRSQIETFEGALKEGGPVLVACTQEARLFQETAEDAGADVALSFTNVRERAGWSEAGGKAGAKIAALLAEAALDIPPAHTVSMRSEGSCLVYGRDQTALEAAQQLAGRLDVTLLLAQPEDIVPPQTIEIPIFRGTVTAARGHLGAFEIEIDDHAPMAVSSRARIGFAAPQDRVRSRCDLILDLTGGTALFPAPEKRDGYFNPDPRNPAAVQKALFELADLVGEFEKPRYVAYDPGICAHSRSKLMGCTRCLDACPASAITSAGDIVEIDPYACGGCGACHSVCPTGAAAYTMPSANSLLERLRSLLGTYAEAGGTNPVLLVHDQARGTEMISMMARFGRGLPANVLPFTVNEATQAGLDLFAGAFAYGASQVLVLVPPQRRDEMAGLEEQTALANEILVGIGYGDGRATLITDDDPDAVEAKLYDLPLLTPPSAATFLPMGNKRTLMMLALAHLHKAAPAPVELLPLTDGAPFGAVTVDASGCTLCLACVGSCPTGALSDNPDTPRLSFTESACVQCGLCQATCPEKVITLEPRLNFTDAARGPVVKHEEEPFECIRCGKPFGTKSAIERIVEQLAGKHDMFQDGAMVDTIKMCEDCRVIARTEVKDEIMAGPQRPRVRTTEDYLREREEEQKQGGDAEAKGRSANRRHNGAGGGTS